MKSTKNLVRNSAFAVGLMASAHSVYAVPVDLELILATDVSGSVDAVDFAARRNGVAAAFNSAAVQDKITSGAIGSIAVALWDYATTSVAAVDWFLINDAASASAFAAAVAAAPRSNTSGFQDNPTLLIEDALAAKTADNGFEGTRFVLDINSEGAQDVAPCAFNQLVCAPLQGARDEFVADGGIINAIWMQDRTFFGRNAGDIIDAFEYGTTNVIGGDGAFQTFAATNDDFVTAIQDKLIREIDPPMETPEPGALLLLGLGLTGAGAIARRKRAA